MMGVLNARGGCATGNGRAKLPTSDQPSRPANGDARPPAGVLSLDCALSSPMFPTHSLIFGEFLVSGDLQNESLIY
jgi:hypothetical protein